MKPGAQSTPSIQLSSLNLLADTDDPQDLIAHMEHILDAAAFVAEHFSGPPNANAPAPNPQPMPEPPFGGDPWAEKRLRRLLNDRWGRRAFASAIAMMLLIIIANGVLAPLYHQFINLRPSRFRQKTFALPWISVSMSAWTLFLGIACFYGTGRDATLFVKRLGRISVALMPPMYLLTLRPSPLPRTFYLQVMPMHKWLSRFVVGIAAAHGVGYAFVYWRADKLWKLTQFANVTGIIALVLFLGMALTGWQKLRRRFYETFYSLHVISAWITLPLIVRHARPPCTGYMQMCFALLVFQVVARLRNSTAARLRVVNISPTMVLVDIPRAQLPPRMWNWSPGAHVRLSGLLWNPLSWLRSSHPYTIASLPDDASIRLVVRKGDYTIGMRRWYSVFGPHRALPLYIESQLHQHLMRRVLLVVGGTGIAFGAPMMRYLRVYGAQVRMVWTIRDPYDARVLPQLGLHDDMLAGNIEVYYTGERLDPNFRVYGDDEDVEIDMSDACCMSENATPTAGRSRRSSSVHSRPPNLNHHSSHSHLLDHHNSNSNAINYGSVNSVNSVRPPPRTSKRVRTDPVLSEYARNMYNQRAHLNLRLKAWLYGYDVDNDTCCCADQIVESCDEDRLGAWVLSCGGPNLVETARQWAELSGVLFFADSFTL